MDDLFPIAVLVFVAVMLLVLIGPSCSVSIVINSKPSVEQSAEPKP